MSLLKDYKINRSFKLQSDLTYDNIMHLINTKNTNRLIQGIVSTCKANKDVIFVVYRYNTNSILLIFGDKPTTVISEGNNLEKILETSTDYGYIYCWCYQKK